MSTSHNYLLTKPVLLGFAFVLTYRSTMRTIDKQNATQQRHQPLSLSQALWPLPTGDLGLRARSMPNSRRQDPKEQRAFMRSILEEAIELANDIDASFPEDTSSDNTGGEQDENSRSHNQDQ
jgi:hypothetical protein